MQLTTLVTTVDFFPEAFIAEESGTIVKRFQKRVTFNSNGQKSYSTVTALTARNEWSERIANGAEVTDLNLQQMALVSQYCPFECPSFTKKGVIPTSSNLISIKH